MARNVKVNDDVSYQDQTLFLDENILLIALLRENLKKLYYQHTMCRLGTF